MNEKIKQMALESNLLWGEYSPRYHGELEDIKKFAELLIKECLEQVDTVSISLDKDDSPLEATGALWAGLAISRHFGIE